MTCQDPLVTILIATKDRPADLRRTLRELKRQDYPHLELLVIDDGSKSSPEHIVRSEWPGARYVRQPVSRGQSQRRSEGFLLATGEYILHIDDDSAPVEANAVRQAVQCMTARPHVGIVSFHIFNGAVLPDRLDRPVAKYTHNFVGCGALLRTAAVRQVGGYQSFFTCEFEEDEYSLRILKAGWGTYFLSDVLIHHHVSSVQRNLARVWMRGFRNKIWAQVMHFPARRLLAEGIWTISLAIWDAVRLFRPHYFVKGIAQLLAGLPRALRLRKPMSAHVGLQYDALRFRQILTQEQFEAPPSFGVMDLWRHYRKGWANRPRQRSFWDRRAGDVGSSQMVKFAHEFRQPAALEPSAAKPASQD